MKKLVGLLCVLLFGLFIKADLSWARTPPASQDRDINIRLRGWNPADFDPEPIDYGLGVADPRAPQLDTSFTQVFTEFGQIRDYNGLGVDASNTNTPGIARVQASPGTPILAPEIGYEVSPGYNYVILHATESDIVIKATAEDDMIMGYGLHFMDINVNPEIKAMYDENEANGREQLVAISCRTIIGTAGNEDPLVVIRDTGSFMDIRSEDWWKWDSPGCSGNPPGFITPRTRPPFDPTVEIACNVWQPFSEYHSLRPYPANPTCNAAVTQELIMCGNNLLAKETFIVNPSDAQSCQPGPDNSQDCHFRISSTTRVGVDLAQAELPIMGNTEDVPNSQGGTNNLSFPQRMSNYVSWYLNGTIQRAEEKFFRADTDMPQMLTFAGPLRKLLPFAVQNAENKTELLFGVVPIQNLEIAPGLRMQQKNNIGTQRHNQTVSCANQENPQECYLRSDYFNSLQWVADSSIVNDGVWPFAGTTINPLDQRFDPNESFSYIPFSSTEDRTGTGNTSESPYGSGEVAITVESFEPIKNNLYFAHMQESSELATALQNTFVPDGLMPQDPKADLQTVSDIEPIVNAPGCVPIETRTNSGDNLYAEPITDTTIGGELSYIAEFDCNFPPPKPDPALVSSCIYNITFQGTRPPTQAEIDICNEQSLVPTPPCVKTAVNVVEFSTQTPLADDVWGRLVGGTMSIFRRIFPKTGVNTPVEKIKDIPAETKAVYSSENIRSSHTVSGQETNAAVSKPGTDASIYFPHIGGVYDYFLQGIQTALLPEGMGPGIGNNTGTGPGSENPPLGTPIDCSPDALRPAFGDQANAASCVADAESSCIPNNFNTSCLRIGGTQDYSFGLFGINLLAHPANDYLVPPDLQVLFDNLAVSEGRSPGYYWTCKQAFNTIGSATKKCDNCFPTMDVVCEVGNRALLDMCEDYFSVAQNNINYAAAFQRVYGWRYWGTAPGCGLI